MANIVPMKVHLLAATQFFARKANEITGWSTDADGGQALAEFAGRACYQSWKKPNPATATNAGYINHILEVGHMSVLEHGHVTFYFEGISRSLSHELVRHRHFSYSQLSQRYVPERDAGLVMPPAARDDKELADLVAEMMEQSVNAYEVLLDSFEEKFKDVEDNTSRRKQARQAARAALPNATETKIVVTGNYRAWRHFINMRAALAADTEIRELAIECLRQLKEVAPNVFSDFEITVLDDGTEIATSNLGEI